MIWLVSLLFASASAQLTGRGFPDCINGPLKNNTVCDATADPLTRATALIAAFSLEEKFNNTGSTSPGVPRLGIPAYTWWNEGLHGVASSPGVNFSTSGNFSYATSFPQPILMGAAFDDDLITQVATVISTEARAFNNFHRAGLDFWTPNINPYNDPRWGRGQETPGEDPFHLSSYVKALINGLQGSDKYKRVVATCKHFVGYDMESWNGNFRYQWDARISQQDLVEYYMPPFKSCAQADVGAFMCSYNAVNGIPTCADPWLLNTILREHWNWTSNQQWITSDCDAVQNIFLPHAYNDTREKAVAQSLIAGVDINCGTYFQELLPRAYAQGLFNISVLDQALIRQYSSLVQLGYFDTAVPYRNLTFSDVNTPQAQQLALQAATEGIVLLKNDGVLPIKLNNTKIALIGGWANATTQMQGNYAGTAPYLHSPYFAAQQLASVNIQAVPGGQGDPTTDNWLPAFDAANKSDIIIYIDGVDNSVEAEGMDRYNLDWTGAQLDMIGQLATHGKPLIVVQMGDQIDSSPILNNVNALLWAGYPGQDGGVAIFDILTGKASPAGRLPVTQYPSRYVSQIPATDMSLRPSNMTGSPGRTYQWYNGKPVFEFGYGLNYTNFSASISGPSSYNISTLLSNCHEQCLDRCPFNTYDVQIHNTGNVSSDYVVLGFLNGIHGPAPHPNKKLAAYSRLHSIPAAGQAVAKLVLTLGSLARVDSNGNTVLYPGTYTFSIDNQPLATTCFTLTGDAVILDKWPQRPDAPKQDLGYFVGDFGSTYGDTLFVGKMT